MIIAITIMTVVAFITSMWFWFGAWDAAEKNNFSLTFLNFIFAVINTIFVASCVKILEKGLGQ